MRAPPAAAHSEPLKVICCTRHRQHRQHQPGDVSSDVVSSNIFVGTP
jgi:hypothetical protein